MNKKESDLLKRQLEESRERLLEAEATLEKENASFHSWSGRHRELSDGIGNVDFLIEQTNQNRETALHDVDESRVHELTEEAEKLKRRKQSLVELHEASVRAEREAESLIKKAEKKVAGYRHEFWHCASQIEIGRIGSNETLLKAWLCAGLGGVVLSYGDFLRNAFPSYDTMILGSLREELFKSYQRKEN